MVSGELERGEVEREQRGQPCEDRLEELEAVHVRSVGGICSETA